MKNILFAFVMMIPFLGNAQSEGIEKFYEKYMHLKEVDMIDLDGFLLNLAIEYSDDSDAKAVKNAIHKLRIMNMDSINYVQKADKLALLRSLRTNKFEELIQVRDDGAKVDILIREEGNKITNLILVVDDVDNFVLLSLEGWIDWKHLENLEIDVEGSEHLEKISSKKKYNRA